MKKSAKWGIILAGAAAGITNGLLGAGGGMILVPLLSALTATNEDQIFPTSVSIILPVCILTLLTRISEIPAVFPQALPYLPGSIPGGILAVLTAKYIPTKWLHRFLGILIIWGGIRYLC